MVKKPEFQSLLTHSSKLAFDFAKKYVSNNLPNEFRYTVQLNVSQDDPNLKQFDIYPSDNEKVIELITNIEIVDLLCRNDKVPVWIDISVDCVYKTFTVFRLLCAGRYSSDDNEFYYSKNGTGPFGIKSPTLSPEYIDGAKFKLKTKNKNSFFSWLTSS